MSKHGASSASKRLSWLLRHGAREAGIAMDEAGWAELADVERALRISRAAIEEAVRENTKRRIEVRGTRIRACQGHSRDGVPVTPEALEASWETYDGDDDVFHGTGIRALAGIARHGILPGERTHVHLARAIDSTVGKRTGVDVMLVVSPPRVREAGIALHASPNGVILARCVPVSALVDLVPQVERARRREAELRAFFGWAEARRAP